MTPNSDPSSPISPDGPPAQPDRSPPPASRRLNWGCGHSGEPGWTNSDLYPGADIDIVGDIRNGLPVHDGMFDYIVSVHALCMIPYPDVVNALSELRRVLRPGGVLRLVLPDFDKMIAAYQARDSSYFLVPDDDEKTLSGKAIVHILWYGYSVLLCTEEFITDLLGRAGFSHVRQCQHGTTHSSMAGITDLDNRPNESFYLEAVR
jgi:SAM-dependent methyltransferase